jgi:hypothetical protein
LLYVSIHSRLHPPTGSVPADRSREEKSNGEIQIKRVADFPEKLAVAGIALAVFQDNYSGIGWAAVFFVASLSMTREA